MKRSGPAVSLMPQSRKTASWPVSWSLGGSGRCHRLPRLKLALQPRENRRRNLGKNLDAILFMSERCAIQACSAFQ
jgi:hypothetical protein